MKLQLAVLLAATTLLLSYLPQLANAERTYEDYSLPVTRSHLLISQAKTALLRMQTWASNNPRIEALSEWEATQTTLVPPTITKETQFFPTTSWKMLRSDYYYVRQAIQTLANLPSSSWKDVPTPVREFYSDMISAEVSAFNDFSEDPGAVINGWPTFTK